MRGHLLTLELCEVYGWTYQDVMNQPEWFVELAADKLTIARKREAAKEKQGSKGGMR